MLERAGAVFGSIRISDGAIVARMIWANSRNNVSMCMSASDDVFAGLFRVRSEALDCEGRVRTLCANGAIPPVSGRISV